VEVVTIADSNEERYGLGLNWWYKNHTSNPEGLPAVPEARSPRDFTLHSYNRMNLQ
jgi:hypothetical protein